VLSVPAGDEVAALNVNQTGRWFRSLTEGMLARGVGKAGPGLTLASGSDGESYSRAL
jgi:hypothetical protein